MEPPPRLPTSSPPAGAVFNQAPPLEGIDMFSTNRPLVEATLRAGAGWALERAARLGRRVGGEPLRWGFQANANPPRLETHDRYGHRIDEVEFHPAWHELMRLGVSEELHALPWRTTEPAGHSARAALYMTAIQAEAGFGCPITMTYAAVPALRAEADLAAQWEPLLTSTDYDPRPIDPAEKGSAICGMAMTERQGGSDVRANTTAATPIGGGEYELTGHKWFCSAPMSDVFLVLAQAPGGLTCFLLPRILPDGTRNRLRLERLKDKLGNRSNASAEVAFDGAWVRRVGPEGRGVPTIIEMVGHTRLDCAIGAAGGMRWAVAQAIHHATHRSAFGRRLIQAPLMRNVLADLALESEAATALAMRLAETYDEDSELKRLATAIGKYWLCKRVPAHAAEALECLGGNGYVEASGMPRLYREAPLASIWEGSGNVICLDVLRALGRRPDALELYLAELDAAAGADRRLDAFAARLRAELADPSERESRARLIVEQMALGLSAALLVRHAPAAVADAFCGARLGGAAGHEYGTLPPGTDFGAIVERHRPV
ncbi:MAG: acyl-CoA dehydrogenase family protein [Solirubrobacteraceae bacterium]